MLKNFGSTVNMKKNCMNIGLEMLRFREMTRSIFIVFSSYSSRCGSKVLFSIRNILYFNRYQGDTKFGELFETRLIF